MKIIKTALAAIFMLYFFNSRACINEFGVTPQGKKVQFSEEVQFYILEAEFDTVKIAKHLKDLKDQLLKKYSFETHSDIAVNLLKSGKYKEGLKILEELNKKHPDNYTICANLGTAYELNGNINMALHYIKKGIEINPGSHRGSEWVHVKILETKLKLIRDPDYLTSNTVLGIDTDTNNLAIPYFKEEWVNVSDTLLHVKYQLQERIPFSPMPDELVSHLLLELGDMYSDYSIEDAWVAYKMADLFTEKNKNSILPKIERMESLMKKYKINTAHLIKFIVPLMVKQKKLSSKEKITAADTVKPLAIKIKEPEKITLVKPIKAEVEKEKDNLAYLFWGLLPVFIALAYIVYRNKKYRKQ